MYNEKLMQVFANPKNVGIIKCADGIGEATNEIGEVCKIFINVKDGVISEAKFKAYGNVTVIAGGSVLTKLLLGKTLDEAINISNDDIVEELGGEVENMASITAVKDAMLLAIKNYNDKQLIED